MVAKWSGVLSTTEPRNDIGILNVRQGNKNSEIAEFQIIENNKPYDLTGLTVLFCASFGLNQVEKTASIVNAKEGKISYTFDDDAMQQVGRNKGYFSIKKAEAMIGSTQEFEYRIQSSIYSRLIDAKSYILRLDVLIKLIEDFIYESKNNVSASIKSFESFITNEKASVNTWVDSMKEIIYGIDPGGSVLRELIEARKDTLNKIFPSLKARLDTFETDTTAQLAQNVNFQGQADFVEMIKNRTRYKEVVVKKITNPYEAISVFAHNGKDHVTHEFRKNTNDDYFIYHVGFLGETKTSPSDRKSTTIKTGVWTSPDGSGNIYTSEIGATFTVSVKGEQITINHMADNRGGLFELVIDGDTNNKINLSTYSKDLVIKNVIIATGLENKEHTIVGTFKGNDPKNSPTSAARGWLRADQTNHVSDERYTAIGGVVYNDTYNKNKTLIAYGSNKDWAFNITKGAETHWFPEHNNLGTAFKLKELKLSVDGVELNYNEMVAEEIYKGEKVHISQKVKCVFPNSVNPLATLENLFTIGSDGIVSHSGKLEFLQDCTVNNGYTHMLPLEQTVLNEFLTSIGTHKKNLSDESNSNLENERDLALSFAGIDFRNPDYIAAVSMDYPLKTLRYGKEGRGNPFYFIHNRAQYPKLYPLVFFNHNAVEGESYNFNGRFAIGKIPGIYNLIK